MRAEGSAAAEAQEAARRPLCWAKAERRAAEPAPAACVGQGAEAGRGSTESGPPAVMWCRPQTEVWSVAELPAGPAGGPQPWSPVTRLWVVSESLPAPLTAKHTLDPTLNNPVTLTTIL